MTITVSQTQTKQVDISLPCFVKYSDLYVKILNENECLKVENWGKHNRAIEVVSLSQYCPFGNDGWEFITEDQFNQALSQVHDYLKTYIK